MAWPCGADLAPDAIYHKLRRIASYPPEHGGWFGGVGARFRLPFLPRPPALPTSPCNPQIDHFMRPPPILVARRACNILAKPAVGTRARRIWKIWSSQAVGRVFNLPCSWQAETFPTARNSPHDRPQPIRITPLDLRLRLHRAPDAPHDEGQHDVRPAVEKHFPARPTGRSPIGRMGDCDRSPGRPGR